MVRGGSIEELGPGSVGVVGIGEGVVVDFGVGICDGRWGGRCDNAGFDVSFVCIGVVNMDSGRASLSVGVIVVLMRRRPEGTARLVVHLVIARATQLRLGSL